MPDAAAVQKMFSGVARRYDLLNQVLSLGIHHRWRRQVVAGLKLSPSDHVLDLCCGTGDLAFEILPQARCTASDFTWNMLTLAKQKSRARQAPLPLTAADALALPFASGSFDAATVGFGLRNLQDMSQGLREIRRALKPGGRLAVLEFSQPTHWLLRRPYGFYLDVLLPRLGEVLSHRGEAYRYLADSIRGFPEPETLVQMMLDAGYAQAEFRRLSGGIVAIHTALV